MPEVSVNIPAYNGEKYIRETIESVLNQTFKDFELIVIDDGSGDKTGEIVKSFNDPRIKYFYQKNQGLGAARNRAIERSTGEYIAFLDQDDIWLPQKLEKQIELFNENPGLGLVFCPAVYFNEGGDLFNVYADEKPPRGLVFRELLKRYFLCLLTVMIRRKVLDVVGLFAAHMKLAEEYDLFLRIAHKYPVDYVDEPLAKYRIHAQNYSRGKNLETIAEERETIERLRQSIPGFDIEYKTELGLKNRSWLRNEGLFFWQAGKRKNARETFKRLAKESPGIKTAGLIILTYLMSYKIFEKMSGWLHFKRPNRNLFLL